MSIPSLLEKIQPAWKKRLMHALARGAGVRADFDAQIERFCEMLAQAVESGDPAWLDPVLYDWVSGSTASDLQEGQKNITALLNQMFLLTYEAGRDNLEPNGALELLGALIPIFTHALEQVARYESDSRVAFVTSELAETQAKLERLERSKSNFIGVAAHELKTPLTLIDGYVAMLRDMLAERNEQIEILFQGIGTGIRRLRTIVEDMIDVSLIDNNMLDLHFQPLWLGQLFTLLENEFAPIVADRHQTLEIRSFPGRDTMLFGDPERLYQAFRNVVNNAIKYTPDGGHITIDGRLLPGFVETTITDTGIGIAPEDQESIFEKFGQLGKLSLHSSSKTRFKGGGPGLGLPIARGIIEAHGGTIWVESDGHDEARCPGSTFHILLPIQAELPDSRLARLFGATSKETT